MHAPLTDSEIKDMHVITILRVNYIHTHFLNFS